MIVYQKGVERVLLMGDNFKGVRAMDPETIYEEDEFLSSRLNDTGPGL